MVTRTAVVASAARKARHSSSRHARSAHRLAILVKTCIAVAPISRARSGARWVPPAIEVWAPRRSAAAGTLRLKFRRAAAQAAPAPRAVQGRALVPVLERVPIVASAGAFALQRAVSADHAEVVVFVVMTEPSADGAALRDAHR